MISEGHAAIGTILIWVTCSATCDHGDVQGGLLPSTMSGYMNL